MKKFLEELNKTQLLYDDTSEHTEAESQYQMLKEKYQCLVGKRALYYCKDDKESRVVTIAGVTDGCVVVQYNYYGMDYEGKQTMSIPYGALISTDARYNVRLEIE